MRGGVINNPRFDNGYDDLHVRPAFYSRYVLRTSCASSYGPPRLLFPSAIEYASVARLTPASGHHVNFCTQSIPVFLRATALSTCRKQVHRRHYYPCQRRPPPHAVSRNQTRLGWPHTSCPTNPRPIEHRSLPMRQIPRCRPLLPTLPLQRLFSVVLGGSRGL